jgi:hypothetical protein
MPLKEDKISHKKNEILRSLTADKASSPYAPNRRIGGVFEKTFPEAFGKYLKFCTEHGLFSRTCLDSNSKA